jgi:hypothetical protein
MFFPGGLCYADVLSDLGICDSYVFLGFGITLYGMMEEERCA